MVSVETIRKVMVRHVFKYALWYDYACVHNVCIGSIMIICIETLLKEMIVGMIVLMGLEIILRDEIGG